MALDCNVYAESISIPTENSVDVYVQEQGGKRSLHFYPLLTVKYHKHGPSTYATVPLLCARV
jgi:hypothetical protein